METKKQKGYREMAIPGFPDYTIDTNLTVRSYKKKQPVVMKSSKAQNRGVYLCREDGMHHFNPPKLKWCAERGIDPTKVDGNRFLVLDDGRIVERSMVDSYQSKNDVNYLPTKGYESRNMALTSLAIIYDGIVAQREAYMNNDYKPMFVFLKENKQIMMSFMSRYLFVRNMMDEIGRRFDELALICVHDLFSKNKVKATLHISAARLMVSLLKEERENPKKLDYEKVQHCMTGSGILQNNKRKRQ